MEKSPKIDNTAENIDASILVLKSFYPSFKTKGNRRFGFVFMIAGDISAAKKAYKKAFEYYQQSEEMYFGDLKYNKTREVSNLYTQMAKSYFDIKNGSEAVIYRDKHETLLK